MERKVDRVLETLPFRIGEKMAESRVAESNRFVRTHRLSRISICQCPIVTGDHALESPRSIGKVYGFPSLTGVIAAGANTGVGIVTVVIAGKADIEAMVLDNDLERCILRPVKAEEAYSDS